MQCTLVRVHFCVNRCPELLWHPDLPGELASFYHFIIAPRSLGMLLLSSHKCILQHYHIKSVKLYHYSPIILKRVLSNSHYISQSLKDWNDASNGKTLVIVESPTKALTIQKIFDKELYVVDFSAGHVRDLGLEPKSSRKSTNLPNAMILEALNLSTSQLGVDVFNSFTPFYKQISGRAEIISRLKAAAKICSRILIATDEDREGEAIAWHLIQVLQPTIPFKRAIFHEITKDAIIQAFLNPRDVNMNLVYSQETRRILDRLVGFTVSPILWRYVALGLSAGRVQSCGLHIIAEVSVFVYDDLNHVL